MIGKTFVRNSHLAKRLSPYDAQAADDLVLIGRKHRPRASSDPGVVVNPAVEISTNVRDEMTGMQRKQDVYLLEVQRLSVEQKAIQVQSVNLLGKIESSAIALNIRQDNRNSRGQDTRKELDSTRNTIQVVNGEMKNTMLNVRDELGHSRHSVQMFSESHDRGTRNLDARTV